MVDILDDWFGINPDPVQQPVSMPFDWFGQQKKAEEEAAAKAALAQARTDAEARARSGAQSYFSERGLDPSQYQSSIDQRIAELMSTINPEDPTPGAHLGGIGESVYGSAQDAARERAQRSLAGTLPTDFEYSRIGSTLDDPFLEQINTAERGKADTFLQNLLKRGVINQTGYGGGTANLDEQSARVRSLLDTLGGDILETGRTGLRDIANRARTRAATLNLGESFDPSSVGGDVESRYNEFLSKLPDQLRAATPSNLYDTSNLSAIAGASQGAQNFKFDPNALAGIVTDDEEERKKQEQEAAQGQSSRGVF